MESVDKSTETRMVLYKEIKPLTVKSVKSNYHFGYNRSSRTSSTFGNSSTFGMYKTPCRTGRYKLPYFDDDDEPIAKGIIKRFTGGDDINPTRRRVDYDGISSDLCLLHVLDDFIKNPTLKIFGTSYSGVFVWSISNLLLTISTYGDIKLFLQYNDSTVLMNCVCSKDRHDLFDYLLSLGVVPTPENLDCSTGTVRDTLLSMGLASDKLFLEACRSGDHVLFNKLILNNVNINGDNKFASMSYLSKFFNPLRNAIDNGHYDMANTLKSLGAVEV